MPLEYIKVKSFADFFKINEYNNCTTQAFLKALIKLLLKSANSLNFNKQA